MGKGALEDLVASPTFRMCQCVCSCVCVEEVRGGKSITSWVHAGKAISARNSPTPVSPPLWTAICILQLNCLQHPHLEVSLCPSPRSSERRARA